MVRLITGIDGIGYAELRLLSVPAGPSSASPPPDYLFTIVVRALLPVARSAGGWEGLRLCRQGGLACMHERASVRAGMLARGVFCSFGEGPSQRMQASMYNEIRQRHGVKHLAS